MKIKASIILPTYNESGNIIKLVENIRHQLSMNRIVNEIIIVDDNSPDKTGILAQKYFSKTRNVKVIIRTGYRGLSTAIRRGIEAAKGEIIVVMDTDFNHEPKLIPVLIKKCQKYDMAIGSRFIRGGGMANKARELYSRLFNICLIKPILGSTVHDNLCGFFAMKLDNLRKLNFDKIFFGYGDYFIRLIYYAKKHDFTFAEAPCFYKDRTYGESKSKFFKMAYDYTISAFKLRLGQ